MKTDTLYNLRRSWMSYEDYSNYLALQLIDEHMHWVDCPCCEFGRVEIVDGDEIIEDMDCDHCDGRGVLQVDSRECECDECRESFFVVSDLDIVKRFKSVHEAIPYAMSYAAGNSCSAQVKTGSNGQMMFSVENNKSFEYSDDFKDLLEMPRLAAQQNI